MPTTWQGYHRPERPPRGAHGCPWGRALTQTAQHCTALHRAHTHTLHCTALHTHTHTHCTAPRTHTLHCTATAAQVRAVRSLWWHPDVLAAMLPPDWRPWAGVCARAAHACTHARACTTRTCARLRTPMYTYARTRARARAHCTCGRGRSARKGLGPARRGTVGVLKGYLRGTVGVLGSARRRNAGVL